MSRGERRARTARICERRLRLWCRNHDTSAPDWSPHYWAKVSSMHCDCRSRLRGRPKQGRGICHNAFDTIRIVHWRQARRDLRELVRRGVEDWDADSVVLLAEAQVEVE